MIPAIYPLVGLVLCLAFAVLVWAGPFARKMSPVFLLSAALTILYAGGKECRWTYLNGVSNNGSTTTTNGFAYANWKFASNAVERIMRAAYRDYSMTNSTGEVIDPWHLLPSVWAIDQRHIFTVPNAERMEYLCWIDEEDPFIARTRSRSIDGKDIPLDVNLIPMLPDELKPKDTKQVIIRVNIGPAETNSVKTTTK